MVFIRRDHPGEEARNAHIAFIQANWSALAKAAYWYYLTEGRGMVLVEESAFMNRPRGTVVRYQLAYMPQSSKEYSKVVPDKEAEWVRTYEPEKTLLVGFIRQDGGLSSYRMDGLGGGAPKKLYEAG